MKIYLISIGITILFLLSMMINPISANFISISNDDELDQFQEKTTASAHFNNKGWYKAQSFIPTRSIITKAELCTKTYTTMGSPNNVLLTIRKDLNGNNLVSPTFVNFESKWLTFDFFDLQIMPGETYYLVFNVDHGDLGWPVNDNKNSYEYGEALYQYNKDTWKQINLDFGFRTYGRDGTNANNPPEIPVQMSTIDFGMVGEEQSFTFRSHDKDGDKVKIRVDWGDGTQPTESDLFDSNEEITLSHVFQEPNVYWMQITAIDEHGSESFYNLESEPIHIKNYQNFAPMKPDIWGDTEGEFREEFEFSAQTWDCDKDDIYYLFDWGDGTASEWLGPYESGEICTASNSWKGFLFTKEYKISVVAKDSNEVKSEWSEEINVKIYQGRNRIYQHSSLIFKILDILKNNLKLMESLQ